MQAQPFAQCNIRVYHTKCTKAGSDSTTAPRREGHSLKSNQKWFALKKALNLRYPKILPKTHPAMDLPLLSITCSS